MSNPPIAHKIPRTTVVHGTTLHDDYFWLRERENPAVHAYLAAENSYLDQHISAQTRATLLAELQARIVPDDEGAPYPIGDFHYFFKYHADQQYPALMRRASTADAPAQLVCDLAREAAGASFFKLGDWAVSPDGVYIALLFDSNGSERFRLHIRRIHDGAEMVEPVPDVYYGLAWSQDGHTLAFVRPDEAWRPSSVWSWQWQRPLAHAECLFHEPNELFNVGLDVSGDQQVFIVTSQSSSSSEVWLFDGSNMRPALCVMPRVPDVKYSVALRGDIIFVRTNADAENNRILTKHRDASTWQEFMAHRQDTFIERMDIFVETCVLWVRRGGLQYGEVYDSQGARHDIQFNDATYTIASCDVQRYTSQVVWYTYATPITPVTMMAYDMRQHTQTVIYRQHIADTTHDPAAYILERVFAPSNDGTPVPLTIVRHRDVACDGTAPALLIGYGAYGANLSVGFVHQRLSLLQRGVVIALAHIRGGSEMGKAWYLAGKLAHKQHTFDDFMACADYMIAQQYTSSARFACRGVSAGGLLIGAVVTQRPALFAAAVALVPFVDVINTILDPSIPLTVPEYEEWGNPHVASEFHTMLAYSPYDNTTTASYPAILMTAGFNDPRVQYWEPAKWIAKLRALTPHGRYYLMTDMHAGHAGKSGRYDALIDTALEYAFLCDTLAIPV